MCYKMSNFLKFLRIYNLTRLIWDSSTETRWYFASKIWAISIWNTIKLWWKCSIFTCCYPVQFDLFFFILYIRWIFLSYRNILKFISAKYITIIKFCIMILNICLNNFFLHIEYIFIFSLLNIFIINLNICS